jgi:hypothetical protein
MEVFASARADGLTVHGGRLYWKVGCGSDLEPPTGVVASRPLAGGPVTTHFAPTTCDGSRVACDRLAVEGDAIYWLSGDGRVLRLPTTASIGTPTTVTRTGLHDLGGWPHRASLAVQDGVVYWCEAAQVLRVPVGGGSPQHVTTLEAEVTGLTAVGGGHLAARAGTDLVVIDLDHAGSPQVVASGVACFAVSDGRLAWATRAVGADGSRLQSRRVDGTTVTTHYQASTAGGAHGEIRSVAIDAAAVYAHEMRNVTGGPLVSARLDGSGHADVSPYFLADPVVCGHDGWVYVSDLTASIYRLPVAAAPVPPPSGVEITGVEVTQGVQTAAGAVPLVAYRRTDVRVFLRADLDALGPWDGVTGRLWVDGASRPVLPRGPYAVTATAAGGNRASDDSCLVFELPPELTSSGSRTLTVQVVPPAGRPTNAPDPRRSVPVTFRTSRDGSPVSVSYYAVRYRLTHVPEAVLTAAGMSVPIDPATRTGTMPERTHEVLLSDRDNAVAFLPVAYVGLAWWPGDPVNSYDYTAPDVPDDQQAYRRGREWAHTLLDMRRPGDPVQRTVVTQPEPDPGWHGACSSLSPPCFLNVMSGTEPGNTMGHELGHSLSMGHTSQIDQNDPSYPRRGRDANDPADAAYGPDPGFDVRSARALPGTDATGQPVLWDVMAYHHTGTMPTSWPAPYTYAKELHAASGGDIDTSGIDGYHP